MIRLSPARTILAITALVLAASACGSSNTDDTERNDAGEVVEGGELGVQRLQLGDCLDVSSEATGETEEVDAFAAIPCEEPHTGEVVLVDDEYFADLDAFPGIDESLAAANPTCVEAVDAYTGTDFATSDFDVLALVPTEAGWDAADDRGLICIGITIAAGQAGAVTTTGSISG